jgi:hypothetical protein
MMDAFRGLLDAIGTCAHSLDATMHCGIMAASQVFVS